MFGTKRKTICQILVQHTDGDILVMKRFDNLELYPGKYEIAVCGEVKENELADEFVKRIVLEQTGMHCESFEKVYEDICLGAPFCKKCFVCIVNDKKEALQMSIPEIESTEWMPRNKWSDILESGKILRNERMSYHDFFHMKGVVSKYYVNKNDVFKYSLEEMESEVKEYVDLEGRHVRVAYAWYDKEIDGVQFYIWHAELPGGYLHYIINETRILTGEEEACFEHYMREGMICDGVDGDTIFRIYMNKYPDLKLSYEQDENPRKLLEELHYFFLGGTKEILYKDGLGELARSLTELSIEYKEDGTTPSEILFDIPFEVLYAINSYRGAMLLTDSKMIKALKTFYQEVPEFFCKKLTDSHIFDLESILENKCRSCYEAEIDTEMPTSHEKLTEQQAYQEYLKNREKLINITQNLPLEPLPKSFWRFYGKAKKMVEYLCYEAEIDKELVEIHEELKKKYAYQDEQYQVVIPKNLREYLQSAEEMFHDYWQFIEFIIYRQTTILLVMDRKKEIVAAIDMVGNSVIDIYAKYNMEVREDIMAWIQNYFKMKNIIYNKMENEDDLPLPFD